MEDGEKTLYDIDGKAISKIKDLAEFHGTIEKSIQQPATFFAMTYKTNGNVDESGNPEYDCDYITKDWVDVSDDDYWGGVSMKRQSTTRVLWATRFRSATPMATLRTLG